MLSRLFFSPGKQLSQVFQHKMNTGNHQYCMFGIKQENNSVYWSRGTFSHFEDKISHYTIAIPTWLIYI